MGVKFCTLNYTVENKKKITVQITSNNNNILYYIDDNGGFIKEAILRVRACCIDEIALAFNALTNRNPGLAPTRHHHNKIIMFYNNSKNTPKKLCFVEYHFSAIYIKKASIQSVLFCEA